MAAPKRTKHQREHDLLRIAELYLKGAKQTDIAGELGIAQSQVSYDLKTIHERWREAAVINANEAKHRELERIDLLERTYWEAWEKSCGDKTKTRTISAPNGKTASIEKETLVGNPSYLAGVERCIELRCKLLGLNAPVRTEVTGKDGGAIRAENAGLTDDERMARLAAIFDGVRARSSGQPDCGV